MRGISVVCVKWQRCWVHRCAPGSPGLQKRQQPPWWPTWAMFYWRLFLEPQGQVALTRVTLLWDYRITVCVATTAFHSTLKAPLLCEVNRASVTLTGL